MKLFCLAILLLTIINVESFREGRFRNHMGRFGWGSGFGVWNRPAFVQPVIVEHPVLTPFGIVERPVVVEQIIRRPFGRVFKKSIDERSPDSFNCTYNASTNMLSCKGFGQSLDCSASRITDDRSTIAFKTFGISSMPLGDWGMKPDEIKFSLYPQQTKSSSFLDTVFVDPTRSNKQFTYSLYFSKKYSDNGIRIENQDCWKKFIDLFPILSTHAQSLSVSKAESSEQIQARIFGWILY